MRGKSFCEWSISVLASIIDLPAARRTKEQSSENVSDSQILKWCAVFSSVVKTTVASLFKWRLRLSPELGRYTRTDVGIVGAEQPIPPKIEGRAARNNREIGVERVVTVLNDWRLVGTEDLGDVLAGGAELSVAVLPEQNNCKGKLAEKFAAVFYALERFCEFVDVIHLRLIRDQVIFLAEV